MALNLAIAFGRLGFADQGDIATTYLERAFKPWCISMKTLSKGIEKETSFRGFLSMIINNPAPAAKFLPYFCSTLIQYIEEGASLDVKQLFLAIMQGVKLTVV